MSVNLEPQSNPEKIIKPEDLVGKDVVQHGYTGQQKVIWGQRPDRLGSAQCHGSLRPFENVTSINWNKKEGRFEAVCGNNGNDERVPCEQGLYFDRESDTFQLINPLQYLGKNL